MTRPVIPVRSLATRLPDAGRIRIGIKVPAGMTKDGRPKSRPEKIDRFRFTSTDRTALDQVAAIYGGQVTPWDEPKAAPGQFQVITDANELRIALPPDPLGNTPIYEMWGGGGAQRRCDGVECEQITKGPDGFDMVQVPCICDRNGALACDLHTRLSVLLPEIRFGGVWRLDSKGRNAAEELPAQVDLIRTLQDRGIVRGTLRVDWRRQVLAGQTVEYAVPKLGVDASLDEIAAGAARFGALGATTSAGELSAGQPAEPGAGELPTAPADPDDDVIDAEIVEDVDHDTLVAAATSNPKKARALMAAAKSAIDGGQPVPESFDDIQDPHLIAAALAALGTTR